MIEDQRLSTDVLEREACGWIAQLVSGTATPQDAEALRRWCDRSPAHAAAFAAAARQWKAFGPAGRELRAEDQAVDILPARRRAVSRRVVWAGGGALAAAAAGWAVISPPFALWPSLAELSGDYRTAIGEQRQVVLSGDVAVRLNTRTSLSVAATSGTEQVTLIAGEALFATGPAASRTFTVMAGGGCSIATRARFVVRALNRGGVVTCLDGEVRVERGGQAATLGVARQLRYGVSGIGPAVTVDPGEVAAWLEGVLVFRATPLPAVIAEINRYRRGRLILVGAALAARRLNGRIRIDRIDDAIGWIVQATGATPHALPGGVVLLG